MPRGAQLIRQWRLVQLLAGRTGRTLAQLQAELAVSKRTVQRDLGDLQAAGFPVVSEPRNGTVFWHFIDGFRAEAALSLSLPEMMALYFSRGLLKPLQGTGLYDALESAMHKIGAALPAQGHSLLNLLGAGIHVSGFGTKDFKRSSAIVQALMKGILHHYTVEISHTVPGYEKAAHRKVDPYKLWYVNSGLYLVGFDHRSKEHRIFAVHRIGAASTTNHRFEIPASFDFRRARETLRPARSAIRSSSGQMAGHAHLERWALGSGSSLRRSARLHGPAQPTLYAGRMDARVHNFHCAVSDPRGQRESGRNQQSAGGDRRDYHEAGQPCRNRRRVG
jgi:predicted DNA-binding transcriptional regulator YafY